MIQARDVVVEFRSGWLGRARFAALDGFSMTAANGAATGLVGANGAGKTTFFRACAGLVAIKAGQLLVDGVDPIKEPSKARELLSLMPEKPGIPRRWTAMDALEAEAALLGLRGRSAKAAIAMEVERWGLGGFAKRQAAGLSRGQQVRVSLARVALRPAPNVILDEPTAGLDFESAATARRWVAELARAGHCVLVATHIVFEIEAMCQARVGLKEGRARPAEEVDGWIGALGAEGRGDAG